MITHSENETTRKAKGTWKKKDQDEKERKYDQDGEKKSTEYKITQNDRSRRIDYMSDRLTKNNNKMPVSSNHLEWKIPREKKNGNKKG